MMDPDLPNPGLEALGLAIVEIIEDVHEDAVTRLPNDPDEAERRIVRLRQAGADTETLAAAMLVLLRRTSVKRL